ncbi:MAG: helix-turn-helix domain-containing protein [Candidatus Korobacteraceae bacterium]
MKLIRKIDDFPNLAHESGYQSQVMAWKLKVSTRTLQRYCLERYRLPIHDVLHRLRMEKALAMVEAGKPLKEVAHDLGFKQYTHFSRAFKEYAGRSPARLGEEIVPPVCQRLRKKIAERLRSLKHDR